MTALFVGRCRRCRKEVQMHLEPRADLRPLPGDLFIPGGTLQRLWHPELEKQRCCYRRVVMRLRRTTDAAACVVGLEGSP